MTRYEIQTLTYVDGWTNVSHDEDGNPLTFATEDEACDDLLNMFDHMVASGMDFDRDDYRVVEAPEPGSLAAFRATRTLHSDFILDSDEGDTPMRYVYADRLFINVLDNGRFVMPLPISEVESDDLAALEEGLWFYATPYDAMLEGDDIDAYVRGYCMMHDITCDGDVFGLYFTEDRPYRADEVDMLILDAARIYNL